ncbi:MAG: VOC family protein [Thalassobaculales bacterium]
MLEHVTGIDHCVILVRDLDSAQATYRRLGFTLAPRAHHSAHMGTGNHTIMLGEDYFEILGVVAPTPENQRWRDFLARREGLTGIALRTDDAEQAAAELRAHGIAAGDPLRFSRPVDLPGGGRTEAAFVVTKLPLEATPGAGMFVCGHLTRDAVWLPSLQRHPNTATALAELLVCCSEPHAVAAPYREFLKSVVNHPDGSATVDTGNTPIRFVTPARVAARHPWLDRSVYAGLAAEGPFVLGLAVTVADLAAARAVLAAAGVTTHATAGGIAVAPADACGVVLELRG